MSTAASQNEKLWAITSYFNPLGYRRRLENYRLFRSALTVPLVAVELSFDGRFALAEGDAEILIQIEGHDVLWQKERLLNIARASLPVGCQKVIWLDCDLVYQQHDWASQVDRLLDRYPLVQAFHHIRHVPPDTAPSDAPNTRPIFSQPSMAAAVEAGRPIRTCLEEAADRTEGKTAVGVAWAAQRWLLNKHGIFDACIVGGGDTALAAAAYGHFEEVMRLHGMNEWQRAYYLKWAEPLFRSVEANVAPLGGDVFHLWHGTMQNRRSKQRHAGLASFDFNPASDIAHDESGCWRWNSEKPALRQYVKDYFAARKEDG